MSTPSSEVPTVIPTYNRLANMRKFAHPMFVISFTEPQAEAEAIKSASTSGRSSIG
jgi:hypothetical protein